MKQNVLNFITIVVAITLGSWFASHAPQKLAGIDISQRNRCQVTVASSTGLLFGQDTRILASSSKLAYGYLQIDPIGTSTLPTTLAATTTIAVAFDDQPAGTSSAVQLSAATTSAIQSIEFGLDTKFPTVGAVHVNALQGGAVIHALECIYP